MEKGRGSLNCPECNEGQFRDEKSLDLHEKSLDLSNYFIFPHKILKSRTFKKSSILIVIMGQKTSTSNAFSYIKFWLQNFF
jgi:hypothetical protein